MALPGVQRFPPYWHQGAGILVSVFGIHGMVPACILPWTTVEMFMVFLSFNHSISRSDTKDLCMAVLSTERHFMMSKSFFGVISLCRA